MGACLPNKKPDYQTKVIYCPNEHPLKYKNSSNPKTITCSSCYANILQNPMLCDQCSYKLCTNCVKNSR